MLSKYIDKKLLFAGLCGLLSLNLCAQQGTQLYTYYVDNSGSDTNNGTSPTAAFRTVAKVNSLSLTPGQSVGFKAGGRWNESLNIVRSGVSYGSYGTGAQPVIAASNPLTVAWTQGSGTAEQETGGIFASGMEATNFTDWTSIQNQTSYLGTNAAQISRESTYITHGSYGMQFVANLGTTQDNRAGLQKTFTAPAAGATLYFRCYMYVPAGTLKINSAIIPMALFTGSTSKVWLQFTTNQSGNISAVELDGNPGYGGSHIVAPTPISFPANAWTEVEFAFKVGATAFSGGGQVWINGVSVASNFAVNTTGGTTINSVVLGNSYYGGGPNAGMSIYYDDFKIDTQFIGSFFSVSGIPATVWYTPQSSNPYYPIFSGLPGTHVSGAGSVTGVGQWYWDGKYIYVYGPGDPGTSVEIPVRNNAATLSGASNVTINNIDFRGGLLECVFGSGQLSNLTVTNSTFELGYRSGFSTIESNATISNYNIAHNIFRYNGALGTNFNVNYQSNNYWGYNYIYNNAQISTTDSEHAFTGGMKWWSQLSSGNTTGIANIGQGTVVEYNQVFNNGVGTSVSGQGAGIWPDTVNGFTVRYNTVYGNKGDGIRMEKTGYSVVHHNVAYNNAAYQYSANIDVTASGGQNSTGNQIFNNTSFGGYWGIAHSAYEGLGPTVISNNTIADNIAEGAATHGNLYAANGGDNNGVDGTGNLYTHNNFGVPVSNFIWYRGTGVSTYAQFESLYGSPTYSLSGDPKFVDASTGQFGLQSGSPCLGTGVQIPGYLLATMPNVGAR